MSALSQIRVVELAEGVAGEYCGKLLSDFGAEVIKIETPGSGSPTRRMGPFGPGGAGPERSGLFAYLNTSKRSVALDLYTDAGRAALAGLLAHADVVIDDHAPGWLDVVGLALDEVLNLHPRLILCAVTPFGQSAPPERKHAEDLTVLHASGWAYHTPSGGEDDRPPLKGPGRFLVSYESGLEAALCIVACIYGREATGRGQVIDISKQEVMASRVDYVLGQMVAGDMDVSESRKAFDLGGPAGILPCRDGFIYVWMSAPEHWTAFRILLGRPAWAEAYPPHWLEREATPERVAECRGHLVEWLKTRDKDAVAAEAQSLGLTLVPLNRPSDLQRSPQLGFRGFFTEVTHPVLGTAVYPTSPYKLGATPARISAPAPLVGQHTDEVLA